MCCAGLPRGLTAIAVILFAELFVYTFGLTLEELSTICVVLMAVNGLTVIYYAARPLDAKRIALLVTMSVALAGGHPLLRRSVRPLRPELCRLAGADRAGAFWWCRCR